MKRRGKNALDSQAGCQEGLKEINQFWKEKLFIAMKNLDIK